MTFDYRVFFIQKVLIFRILIADDLKGRDRQFASWRRHKTPHHRVDLASPRATGDLSSPTRCQNNTQILPKV